MRKRPVLLLACQFLLGILCCSNRLPVCIIPAVLLIIYAAPWKEQGIRRVLFAAGLPLFFLLGWFATYRELTFRQQYMQKIWDGQNVVLAGKIERIEEKSKWDYYYLTDCTIRLSEKHMHCNDVIAYVSDDTYSIGQILVIEGTISYFDQAVNEGMFDARRFYQSQKIDFGIRADKVKAVHGKPDRYRCALRNLKSRMEAVLKHSIEDDGVLSAMLLGEKNGLDAEIKTLYQRAGISHILAISGLHVSLLGMGLYRLLRKKFHGTYPLSIGLTASFMVSYAVLSGNGVSVRRAVGMLLIYLLADLTGHAYDLLSALSAMILVLLWENPFLTGYSGFLFSVAAVFGIGIVSNILAEKDRQEDMGQDDWREGKSKKKEKSRKNRDGIWISLGIQLFTLPLVTACYYELPVYAMAVNAIVLLFVSWLLGISAVGTVLGLFILPLGKLLLAPCGWILSLYRFLCEKILSIPGAQYISGKPENAQIIGYYCLLTVVLFLAWKALRQSRRQEKPIRKGMCAVLLSGIVLSIGILLFPAKTQMEIDMLDVGQGDGIYLCTGDGVSMFIDGGSSDVKNVGTYRILPFLKAKGVKEISYWFVSHTDADHISGVKEVLTLGFPVQHLILAESAREKDGTKKLEELARKSGTKVHYMKTGDTCHSGQAVLTCLYPDAGADREDMNDLCLVLLYEERGLKALFGGDIPAEVEESLVAENKLTTVHFYKADHHGSNNSSCEVFMETISPEISAVSAGKDNRYGHPGKYAVERIKDSGSRFYCTMDGGRLRILVRDGRLVCEPYLKQ